jgi:hypothetical protein
MILPYKERFDFAIMPSIGGHEIPTMSCLFKGHWCSTGEGKGKEKRSSSARLHGFGCPPGIHWHCK